MRSIESWEISQILDEYGMVSPGGSSDGRGLLYTALLIYKLKKHGQLDNYKQPFLEAYREHVRKNFYSIKKTPSGEYGEASVFDRFAFIYAIAMTDNSREKQPLSARFKTQAELAQKAASNYMLKKFWLHAYVAPAKKTFWIKFLLNCIVRGGENKIVAFLVCDLLGWPKPSIKRVTKQTFPKGHLLHKLRR